LEGLDYEVLSELLTFSIHLILIDLALAALLQTRELPMRGYQELRPLLPVFVADQLL